MARAKTRASVDSRVLTAARALGADAQHQPPAQAKASRAMAHNLVHPPAAAELPHVRCSGCRKLRIENERRRHENAALRARIAEMEGENSTAPCSFKPEVGGAHG